ncbi:hypothetical protein LCGC14_1885810 [marine sediment metagenome]|uniref:Peptidase M16 N-terminal domain-containing protein n=1 Tax=marine sediment metagenome TaxID=412755 RepID=A0A0F9IEV8_9ZZZZ
MRYKYRSHPSKLATLMVTCGAGGRTEFGTKYPIGIAHFVEHVRFKGTDKYTAKDLSKRIADGGGSWNAYTSEDLVSYFITIPEENIEIAFECLSEIVLNPIFPQKELDKEQEVVCQEVRMYDDQIDNLVHYRMMNTVFNNSMKTPIVGTEESVKSITREHLLQFNKEFYSKEHMLISLATTGNHQQLAEKYFGQLDDICVYRPPDNKIIYAPAASCVVEKEGQLQNSLSVCFGNEDVHQSLKLERHTHTMFNNVFGSGSASRLFMSVREDLGLVYGIGAYLNCNMDGTLYEIYTSTEPENSDKVIDAIDKQIEIMLKEPPTGREMQRAKNRARSAMYSKLDTSSGAISDMVNEEFYQYETGSEFLAKVDKVTAEDVHELAKMVFAGTKYTVVGTGK